MANQDPSGSTEKTRICPSCRMSISVLATKCRFCAEDVGRPKEETRELSVGDMGGETITHVGPSGSLMEAVEDYRASESNRMSQEELDTKFDNSLQYELDPSKLGGDLLPSASGIPALDGKGADSISLSVTDSHILGRKALPRTTRKDRLVAFGKAVGIVVVLMFVAVKGFGFAKDWYTEYTKEPEIEFDNRAPALRAQGRPPIEVLKAAVEAVGVVSSGANLKIAEDALRAVGENVTALLDADPWTIHKLSEASVLATRMTNLSPNATSLRYKTLVVKENALYRMMLTGLDKAAGTVTFKLNKPGFPERTYKIGSMIEGRFMVKRIVGKTARLEDTMRKTRFGRHRPLTYEMYGLPR